jgi:hypothetical protein
VNLVATLRRNRNIPGELVALDDDGNVIHRCVCLGKADNIAAVNAGNPTRNPLLRFGDTPTGLWRCRKHGPVQPAATYGVYPVIVMTPVSGDALLSHRGPQPRSGIWLHGGAPGRNSATAFLRPTFGCLRVADDDMGQIWTLAATFGEPETLEVVEAA